MLKQPVLKAVRYLVKIMVTVGIIRIGEPVVSNQVKLQAARELILTVIALPDGTVVAPRFVTELHATATLRLKLVQAVMQHLLPVAVQVVPAVGR